MTTSRPWARVTILSAVRALPAGLLLLAACGTPPPALEPERPVERELRGGQSQEYRLELDADWYARLKLSQPGIDITASVYAPTGEKVSSTAGLSGTGNVEIVSWVTDRRGGYRLVVEPRDPKASPGRYLLLLQELRPAVATDGRRVAAERMMEEGRRYGQVPATRSHAIQQLSAALVLWRDIGEVRGEVDTLNLLGPCYRQEGQTAKAIALYRTAAQQAGRAGYPRGEALSFNNLGYALHQQGKFDEAAVAYRRSLALWTREEDAGEQCFLLQNLGQLHLDMGRLTDALGFFRQALAVAPTPGDQANALGSIGLIQHRLGDADGALGNLLHARALSAAAGDHGDRALIAATIGFIRFRRGEFQEALLEFEEALGQNPDPGTRAIILQNQAPIFIDLGDLDRALASYREAAVLFAGLGNRAWEDHCRIGIGWIRQIQGDPQGALEEYDRVTTQGPTYERALAYWSVGQPGRAAELLEQELPRVRAVGDRVREGEMHLALGAAYRDLGRHRQARESLTRAVKLGRDGEAPGIVAAGLFRLASMTRDASRLDAAQSYAEEAVDVVESMRSRVAGRELKISFFATRRAYYELLVDILLRQDRNRPGRGYLEAAFAASERGRARVLVDLLAEAGNARQEARRRAGEAPDQAETALLRDRRPSLAGLEEVRALLDERTALLEYALGEDGSALFVITRERLEAFRLPPAAAIDHKVQRLRQKLSRPQRRPREVAAFAEEAHQLYRELVAPALAAIDGKSRLVIAPDQSLYLLPFEALLTAPASGVRFDRMPFLVSQHTISYAPSASVLSTLQRARPRRARFPFVAFAVPTPSAAAILASGSSRGLPQLPDTIREVTEIAGTFAPGESRLYMDDEATEEKVKNDPRVRNARYLHFATHGLLHEKHPERSGLALGQESGDGEDGFLQAFEVFQLNLAADLVVLSACHTSGKEVSGEGLVGLTQAFLYAGATSVQVSLWAVADAPSADLMVGFYGQLRGTEDRAGALRRAKLAMISGSRYAHPYYWASFILIGDPGGRQGPAVTFLANVCQ